MSTQQELASAWDRVDERIAALQRRHHERGDVDLYDAQLNVPATENDLAKLNHALIMEAPFELLYSLRRWNGRWIAPDHALDLGSVSFLVAAKEAITWTEEEAEQSFEEVQGPINPVMHSPRRIAFGYHDQSGSTLFLDYEDPPAGGRLGQVIRIGEEPIAQWVAGSFVEFLNLVADAPVHDDDPDFDPLQWPR